MNTPIDDYLANVEPSKRKALERIRKLAKKAVPDAVETISYKMPTLTYRGEPFLGFAARSNFIGLYPFSGSVISTLAEMLSAYKTSKGAIRIPLETPIRESTLRALIKRRIEAIRGNINASDITRHQLDGHLKSSTTKP